MMAQTLIPIGIIKVAWQLLTLPFEKNCIKRSTMKKEKVIRISDEFDLPSFKKACKSHKCSATVATYTILGKAIKEYADLNNDKDLKHVTIGSTFSTEPFPSSVAELYPKNSWVPQYMQLPVDHDFGKMLEINKTN